MTKMIDMTNMLMRDENAVNMFRPLTSMTIGVHRPFDAKVAYYIQRHTCPSLDCRYEILTCSCPSFQMQKPSHGVDAFHKPCKHIEELVSIPEWSEWMARILVSLMAQKWGESRGEKA